MPKVKASAQKKVAQVKAIKKPVLVLGWGREGSKDVHRIADTFRHDGSIDCVASQFANSREALGEVAKWLKGHDNPQTLFLGAHGDNTGLMRTSRDVDKLGYRELSETIGRNLSADAARLNIVLGACKSSHAAAAWNELKQAAINSLVAFPEEPNSAMVQAVLTEVLRQGNIVGAIEGEEQEITYLDNWVEGMRLKLPKVLFYYKGAQSELIDAQTLPAEGESSFANLLTQRGQLEPGHGLLEVAERATLLPNLPRITSVPPVVDRAPLHVRSFGKGKEPAKKVR